jgi:hypothetical protein
VALSSENGLCLRKQLTRELLKIPDLILFVDRPYFKNGIGNTQEGCAFTGFNYLPVYNPNQSKIHLYGRIIFFHHRLPTENG